MNTVNEEVELIMSRPKFIVDHIIYKIGLRGYVYRWSVFHEWLKSEVTKAELHDGIQDIVELKRMIN